MRSRLPSVLISAAGCLPLAGCFLSPTVFLGEPDDGANAPVVFAAMPLRPGVAGSSGSGNAVAVAFSLPAVATTSPGPVMQPAAIGPSLTLFPGPFAPEGAAPRAQQATAPTSFAAPQTEVPTSAAQTAANDPAPAMWLPPVPPINTTIAMGNLLPQASPGGSGAYAPIVAEITPVVTPLPPALTLFVSALALLLSTPFLRRKS